MYKTQGRKLRERQIKRGGCQFFLKCKNPATTTIPNPILGAVPACQRCADWHKSMS